MYFTPFLHQDSHDTAAAYHHQCTAATQLVTKLGFMTFQFSLQKKRSENHLNQGKMSFSFSAEILSCLQDETISKAWPKQSEKNSKHGNLDSFRDSDWA